MRAALVIVAAALCVAWAQAGVAADDTEPGPIVMQVIDTDVDQEDVRIAAGSDGSAVEPQWAAGHRLALAVAREESQRPAFDESASVVFLQTAF